MELTKLIESCGEIVPYDEYNGCYIAIDAFQKIYKYCISKQKSNFSTGNEHLKIIIKCIEHMSKHNIIPLFVFDGMSIVRKVNNKRKQLAKNENLNNDKVTQNNPNEQIIIKNDFKITPKQIKDCETLLSYLGYPSIRAPHEADSQCAGLTLYDSHNDIKIPSVLTDDTDALVFCSKSIIKMLPIKLVNELKSILNDFTKCIDKYDERKEFSLKDMCLITSHNICMFENKLNLGKKYTLDEINNMIGNDNNTNEINFAIRYSSDTVRNFLKQKANNILLKNNKNQLGNFEHIKFVELCVLLGTDYLNRIGKLTINEIFKEYVLSDCDLHKYFDTLKTKYNIIVDETTKNTIYDICEYYINATIIDPRSIDYNVYRPNETELYKFLENNNFTHRQTIDIINNIKFNFLHSKTVS